MLKKLIKKLFGYGSSSHKYRKYSSSDYNHSKHRPHQGHGYPSYGKSHYKRKHSSGSFFSS